MVSDTVSCTVPRSPRVRDCCQDESFQNAGSLTGRLLGLPAPGDPIDVTAIWAPVNHYTATTYI